jgi:hypothetical protein
MESKAMKVLRTPDDRFAGIADYPFAPHYAEVTDKATGTKLRLHYIDEGPRDAAPVLLMHGEPSWSYLYRKFVGPLVGAGHRVVVPDLIGFGKSDSLACASSPPSRIALPASSSATQGCPSAPAGRKASRPGWSSASACRNSRLASSSTAAPPVT